MIGKSATILGTWGNSRSRAATTGTEGDCGQRRNREADHASSRRNVAWTPTIRKTSQALASHYADDAALANPGAALVDRHPSRIATEHQRASLPTRHLKIQFASDRDRRRVIPPSLPPPVVTTR